MPDPETIVVKSGIIVLALLTVLRFIVHEVQNLKEDLSGKRRRR
jgi:hypothetical protein